MLQKPLEIFSSFQVFDIPTLFLGYCAKTVVRNGCRLKCPSQNKSSALHVFVLELSVCNPLVKQVGIRGTQVKSSIQDVVNELAPIKKAPYGVEG